MCFQFYEGKGYSEDFTDHMGRIIREMEADPAQMVVLKVQTDIVCENCPNRVGGGDGAGGIDGVGGFGGRGGAEGIGCAGGVCESQAKVIRYDEEVLKACGFSEGDEMSYGEFISKVRECVIETGLRSRICGDCSWDGICGEKEGGV